MREINASIPFDKRLWRQDIAGSKAHVAMLGAQGILKAEDVVAIAEGLDAVAEDYARDGVPDDLALEDIHMLTEARLAEKVGPVAGRLHTARSRNDQVATDFRLWVRDAIDQVAAALGELQDALIARAEEHECARPVAGGPALGVRRDRRHLRADRGERDGLFRPAALVAGVRRDGDGKRHGAEIPAG